MGPNSNKELIRVDSSIVIMIDGRVGGNVCSLECPVASAVQ